MRVVSLFAGIGGFDLAFERCGHEVVWANEWDTYAGDIYDKNFGDEAKAKRAREVYQKRLRIGENQGKVERYEGLGGGRPETQQYTNRSAIGQYDFTDTSKRPTGHRVDRRDITTVDAADIPDHDILVGGFPCQAFSVAGRRRGFDDTRGTLFFDVARILDHKRPRYFVLENVKGLLSHDGGKTLQTIFGVLADLGYGFQWQVLNSKDFGVPQNRERIFIVGHLRGEPRPQVFPLGETDRAADPRPESGDSTVEIARTLRSRYDNGSGSYIAEPMVIDHGERTAIVQLNPRVPQSQRVYDRGGLSPTLDVAAGGNRQPKIMKPQLKFVGGVGEPNRIEGGAGLSREYKQGYRVYSDEGIANCLPAQAVGGPGGATGLYQTGTQIRRLTPLECERLQGFPDNWTAEGINGPISDTQRYKVLGNAVTTNVVEAIVRRFTNVG